MWSRVSPIPVFLVLVGFLASYASAGGNGQGSRNFINACDGCVVSKGIGFQSFFDDCTCFYTCRFVQSHKLSSMASEYVSYKKCCGCGESFSKKLLTCVKYYDKRSDCFDENSEAENPCEGLEEGDRVPRQSAAAVFGDLSTLCSGFTECKNVSGTIVPEPKCCPDGDCYDDGQEACTETCGSPACEALREEDEDDCECERTEAPESECQYMAMENSNVKFMHIQEMRSYDCPPGTCWDQELCTCVTANNTGFNECEEYVDMEFGNDLKARDSRGALLYTTIHEDVTLSGGEAVFPGGPGEDSINIVATANAWLSNTLVVHFEFELTEGEIDESSANENQCMMGNCKIVEQSSPADEDTLAVTVERDEGSEGEEINVHLEYQNKIFMNIENSEGEVDLELEGPFALDTEYEFWLIYCGDEEFVIAGIIDSDGEAIAADAVAVEGSVQIKDSQTGFVFGNCERGENYEGTLDEVEIYKNCKPVDDEEYEAAFEEISNALPQVIG